MMDKTALQILKYWRLSLIDSVNTSASICVEKEKFCKVSCEESEKGILDQKTLDLLFRDVSDDEQCIPVSYRPLYARRRSLHGYKPSSKKGPPSEVTPIITRATVTREGQIIPHEVFISRDILAPLENDSLLIGHIDDFDTFLTRQPFIAKEDNPDLWQQYQSYWKAMMDEVGGDWPNSDSRYDLVDQGLIRAETNEDADMVPTIRATKELFDYVIKEEPSNLLIENFARLTPAGIEDTQKPPFRLFERLGHPSPRFPLANHQREVLVHLAAAKGGDILAVNGPPGTGKTTMILSVVAGEWIRAALNKVMPPLTVAVSNNNQAVTNIIDAFGKDFAHGEGPFAGRWLPGIKSFGLYLPSQTQAKKSASTKEYQTEDFYKECERTEYVDEAKTAYLEFAQKAFPDLECVKVKSVVDRLHRCLQEESNKLVEADGAYKKFCGAHEAVQHMLGDDPDTALLNRHKEKKHFLSQDDFAKGLVQKWEGFLVDEPIWLSLLSFLPPIAKKRLLRARVCLRKIRAPTEITSVQVFGNISKQLEAFANNAAMLARSATEAYNQAKQAFDKLKCTDVNWKKVTVGLLSDSQQHDDLYMAFDRAADCSIRFRLFLIATHYWEGRWLLEMEKVQKTANRVHDCDNDRCLVEPMWLRRMMLTPCAVSTFATLPSKMKCRGRGQDGKSDWQDEYLLNYIDLLIVDEAGQVTPQNAGPSFALAKRALVIGDCQQIRPISNLSSVVDYGNLKKIGLLQENDPEKRNALSEVGVTASRGSVMRLAQSACRFAPYHPKLDRGLYLFEHRRCFNEIISFSNDLCYEGHLLPMRGPAKDTILPPMGYLHINGIAESKNGSRYNGLEAQTIAKWISDKAEELKSYYGKRLGDVVGVLTPFTSQKNKIIEACKAKGIDVNSGTGVTVGTIHALQGAERDVILFSPVYSKHSSGSFIDRSPDILNVAVSRAKDTFLLFGDMDDLASVAPHTPRSMLFKRLVSDNSNELAFDVPPRSDLIQQGLGKPEFLYNAHGHHEFLQKELSRVMRKISVVSPWINIATMEKDGFMEAITAACARGVEVGIYADPQLTKQSAFAEACQRLIRIGATVHAVKKLHSKLVWADDAFLAVGSFNWFSAHSTGEFARHETSYVYRGDHLGTEIRKIEESFVARKLTYYDGNSSSVKKATSAQAVLTQESNVS